MLQSLTYPGVENGAIFCHLLKTLLFWWDSLLSWLDFVDITLIIMLHNMYFMFDNKPWYIRSLPFPFFNKQVIWQTAKNIPYLEALMNLEMEI